MILILLLQAQAPDIQLEANFRARSVTIEKQGDARLKVTSSPDGGGNLVDIRGPKVNGQRSLRNVEVKVRGEARIGDPAAARANNPASPETSPRQ